MFSITAKKSKLTITGLGLLGKDEKESDLWVYYQLGSYQEDFDALDKDEWIEFFKDKVVLDPDDLVNIDLTDDIIIPVGETVSLYVLSKKGIMYDKSSYDEFDMYAESEDFILKVGTTTKKEFQTARELGRICRSHHLSDLRMNCCVYYRCVGRGFIRCIGFVPRSCWTVFILLFVQNNSLRYSLLCFLMQTAADHLSRYFTKVHEY